MKRIVVIPLIALLLLAGMMAGCADDGDEGDIKIADQTGETVTFSETPERIVSLAPSITEILFVLGLEDKIVGIDDASTYPAATADITKVSSWSGLDMEMVISVDPDVIIMDKTLDMSGERYTTLTEYDLVVFQVFPKTFEDVLEQISLIGKLCDVEEKAEEVVDGLQARIDVVESKTIDEKPKILYVTYYDGMDNPWVGTDHTFSGDMIEKAGGENIITDNSGICIQVSIETIMDENPDIIFTSQSSSWPTTSRDSILADDNLGQVTAVKNGDVYDIDGDLVDRTGPRLVDGLELMQQYITA